MLGEAKYLKKERLVELVKGEELLGFHAPTTGGIDKAPGRLKELNCSTGQIFSKNNRQWKARDFYENEISDFQKAADKLDGPIVVHSSYLINLGNPDDEKWKKSVRALIIEIERVDCLSLKDLVLHPGLHVGSGEEAGMKQIIEGLNQALEETAGLDARVSLEVTAGQGSSLGYRFEQLRELKEGVDKPERISYCLDSCHMFSAGYDLSSEKAYEQTMQEVENVLGIEDVKAIHLNDSLNECGSKVDRHADIGEGQIGAEGFRCLMNDKRWGKTPKILETPVEESWRESYGKNLERLRSLKV